MSLHTGYTIGTSRTHSDMLDSDIVRCSLVREMEVRDAGPSQLGYYNSKQLLEQICKCKTCHMRLTCTRIYDTCVQSAHWREVKMRMRIPSNTKIIAGQERQLVWQERRLGGRDSLVGEGTLSLSLLHPHPQLVPPPPPTLPLPSSPSPSSPLPLPLPPPPSSSPSLLPTLLISATSYTKQQGTHFKLSTKKAMQNTRLYPADPVDSAVSVGTAGILEYRGGSCCRG